ncbi:MAG: hypothetical protein NC236_00180 [Mycoplasma sp.]|nr:hypothetical protein [Mycoplasma sp.]
MNKNFIHNALKLNAVDPTEKNYFISLGGIDYIFAGVLILIGIFVLVFFQKKARHNTDLYKKRQLEEYNKKRKIKETDYDKTGLYLPMWERAKRNAPFMIFATFIIIGVIWIIYTATGKTS